MFCILKYIHALSCVLLSCFTTGKYFICMYVLCMLFDSCMLCFVFMLLCFVVFFYQISGGACLSCSSVYITWNLQQNKIDFTLHQQGFAVDFYYTVMSIDNNIAFYKRNERMDNCVPNPLMNTHDSE